MNGARGRMARWHALLRRIVAEFDIVITKSDTDIKAELKMIREQMNILDEDIQNRRVIADNYAMVMKLDIPFTQKFLQDAELEILAEALRDQPAVIGKLLYAIERAKIS